MSRSTTTNQETLSASEHIYIALLYKAEGFTGGTIRRWTGFTNIDIGGETYEGSGDFLQVSAVEESAEISAKGASISISGIEPDRLSEALTEDYTGNAVTISLAMFDAGGLLVDDPIVFFKGLIDVMTIDEDGTSATITVACESRLASLLQPRITRYTHQDQKKRFAGDKGFEHVEKTQEAEIVFRA